MLLVLYIINNKDYETPKANTSASKRNTKQPNT